MGVGTRIFSIHRPKNFDRIERKNPQEMAAVKVALEDEERRDLTTQGKPQATPIADRSLVLSPA